jgi:hypothetical protein
MALILVGAGAWRLRRSRPALPGVSAPLRDDRPIVLTVAVLTAAALLLQPLGLFHAHSTGDTLDIDAVAHLVNFGDQISLLGYKASDERPAAGDRLDLTLYWRARRALDIDYQVFVHLLDAEGNLVAQSDKLNPGEFPTRRWPLDRYVPDAHTLVLPADLPPGDYTVAAGLWVQGEGWRLPVFDSDGRPVGDRATLFSVRID